MAKFISITGGKGTVTSAINIDHIMCVIDGSELTERDSNTNAAIMVTNGAFVSCKETKDRIMQLIEAADRS